MNALQALSMIRARGRRPEFVMIEVGTVKQSAWWFEPDPIVTIAVPDSANLRDMDLRPIVGCEVIVLGLSSINRLRAVVERAKQHAGSMTVLSGSDPDNLGHVWERGRGWRAFGVEQREVA